MPLVVSLDDFAERAGELVEAVRSRGEPVVVEEGTQAVAVIAPAPSSDLDSPVDLPEWREWIDQARAAFPRTAELQSSATSTTETLVDKSLLGFDPQVGQVGSEAGREYLVAELQRLGVPILDDALLAPIYATVLELCESKSIVFEEDLKVLAHEAIAEAPQRLRLLTMTVQCTTGIPAMAEVTLELSHGPAMRRAQGDGPLHAAFTAIEKLVGIEPEVDNFSVVAATRGQDAIAEATIQLSFDGLTVAGRGASTDAIEAGVHAYLNALNFLLESRRSETAAPQIAD